MFAVRDFPSEARWVYLACALMMSTLTGCPEEQATTAVVREPVPILPVQPTAPPNPNSIEINVGELVKTDDCQSQLLTFSGERPSVLMVKSYLDAQQETLPSAMLQAHVSAREPASLVGTTVKAEVYLMTADPASSSPGDDGSLAGVTWHTPPGELADVKITAVDGQRLTGEIVSGELVNTSTQKRHPLKGRFTGPLQ